MELVGREKICIQHDASLIWPVLERREYLIRFRYPPSVAKRCIKTIRRILPHDLGRAGGQSLVSQVNSTRDDVVMRLGSFAVAEMDTTIGGRDVKLGIAVRRCSDSVTMQVWLGQSTADFETWVERLRSTLLQISDRVDTVELEPVPGHRIEIRLRPKRGRVIEDPNGERQRLETMLVEISPQRRLSLPMR